MTRLPEFPLLRRELVALLRTRRAIWLMAAAVAVAGLLPLVQWPAEERAIVASFQARAVFAVFVITQLTTVLLLVPAFTAAAIAGERERGTYELLYSTLLSPLSIVLSKLLASCGYLVLLLVASAPAVVVLFLLGGIGFETVLASYAVTLAAVLASALVCLAVSMRSRKTGHAAVRGFVWVIVWNGGGQIVLMLLAYLGHLLFGRASGAEDVAVGLALATPYAALVCVIELPPFGGWLPVPPWAVYPCVAAVVGAGHLVYLLRRVRLPELVASPRRERRAVKARRARRRARVALSTKTVLSAIGDRRPVFRREIGAEFVGRAWYRRVLFWTPLAVFGLLAAFVIEELPGGDDAEGVAIAIGELCLGLTVLIAPAAMASSIPREIEQGSFDLLRGTLLDFGSVFAEKMRAAAFGIIGIPAAALIAFAIAFPFTDGPDDLSLIGSVGAGVVYFLSFAFALSVAGFFAALCRRSVTALVGTYVTVLGLYAGLPFLLVLGMMAGGAGRDAEVFLASVSPFGTMAYCIFADADETAPAFFMFCLWYGLGTFMAYLVGSGMLAEEKLRDR